jgi:hypothetical protein
LIDADSARNIKTLRSKRTIIVSSRFHKLAPGVS